MGDRTSLSARLLHLGFCKNKYELLKVLSEPDGLMHPV
jgi:hypothetical protein